MCRCTEQMKASRPDITGLEIRPLGPEDAAAYRAVRLQLLRDFPTTFVTTPEEFAALPLSELGRR